MAEQIAAIQTAGHEFLLSRPDPDGAGARQIRVEISIGPDSDESQGQYNSVDCWTEDVLCGKGATGYIHCKVRVCMEVGPI